MTVRPKDLREEETSSDRVLHCGECLLNFSANKRDWDWMFPNDLIACQSCGGELALTETLTIEV